MISPPVGDLSWRESLFPFKTDICLADETDHLPSQATPLRARRIGPNVIANSPIDSNPQQKSGTFLHKMSFARPCFSPLISPQQSSAIHKNLFKFKVLPSTPFLTILSGTYLADYQNKPFHEKLYKK